MFLSHIGSFNINKEIQEFITLCENKVDNLIKEVGIDACYDSGRFVGLSKSLDFTNNTEFGLGRLHNKEAVKTLCFNVLDQFGYSKEDIHNVVDEADLLFFSEVDEHSDDHGERLLIVLRAPNGFELNVIDDENDDIYSEPLYAHQLYRFNENEPHHVSRYDYMERCKEDNELDYCIAINLPSHRLKSIY